MTMQLTILLPSHVLLDAAVTKIIAQAPNGAFALLPRHIDMVSSLVPGLVSFTGKESIEHFAGTDEGILVKCGQQVTIATRQAILSDNLEQLREQVHDMFVDLGQRERTARSALARLEAGVVRRFVELARQT